MIQYNEIDECVQCVLCYIQFDLYVDKGKGIDLLRFMRQIFVH